MRQYAKVTTAGESLTLPFEADSLAVINTTRYNLAVRVGSNEKPAILAAATVFFPPGTMAALPVSGHDFGMSLLSASPPASHPNVPDVAQVIFYAAEIPPSFAAASVDDLQLFGAVNEDYVRPILPRAVRSAFVQATSGLAMVGKNGCMFRIRVWAKPVSARTLQLFLYAIDGIGIYWAATALVNAVGDYYYFLGPGCTEVTNQQTLERAPVPVLDGSIVAVNPSNSGAGEDWEYSVEYQPF